ncbi:FAD-dependent oxidoreductase [Sphingobacterium hotanense]|uniref:FAD-dependent oxidoreductase n=1 Tax=Sphingobacterium hotanense TaxID=649196 RepID=UPI0021A7925F|nr:FAD-dependent oxidoreductase [Sphingobacterium hotanense]MCT1523880.1 FAD-dependent oxidoreductase [Sphingobacterium hotanense]
MNRLIIITLFLISLIPSQTAKANMVQSYDIVIYGATSSGVIAAYTAAKEGKKVVLIGTDTHIGGLSSGGLGQTDIGNKMVIGGMSRDFYKRLGTYYNQDEAWVFEPSAASKVFAQYLTDAKIPLILNKKVLKVNKAQNTINSITLVNTLGKPGKPQTISAKVFLDCTYEGDLLAMAGVSYTVGREDNTLYDEQYSGYHLPEYRKASGYHQFPDHVSPYVIKDDPKSGLLWGISNMQPRKNGDGDKGVQAYNFRICLTDSLENMIPISKPDNYDPKKYELLIRVFESQPNDRTIGSYFIWSKMPNRKTDINNRGAFSTDMIGANHNWPEATHEERKKIYKEHLDYTKGLLFFYTTDSRVPDTLRNFVKQWGYPKDEYKNNQNFTPQIYVREGRRMIGEYVMTENNCTGKRNAEDPVGMAAYGMDSHNVNRLVVNGMVKNEGNVEIGGFKPYPISYRSITPKKNECSNLLVPVSMSSSHIAFGSIRMEPVFMVLGESAALAAVQAIDEKKAVQDINYNTLRAKLLAKGQILEFNK